MARFMRAIQFAIKLDGPDKPGHDSPGWRASMPENSRAFVKSMVQRFPALRPLYDKHRKDNRETLPHVFFGEVARLVVEAFNDSRDERSSRIREATEMLEFLEGAYTEADTNLHDGIRNLIVANLLEYLMFPTKAGEVAVRKILGPALKAQLIAMESWKPEHR
jgi:hypothetical protein